jgi:hypothetical protein
LHCSFGQFILDTEVTMTKQYISPLIEKLLSEVSPEQFEATSKQMEPQGPKAEAQDLVLTFYYSLPNNGSLNHGINSCESRYKEAVMCAKLSLERIILALEAHSWQNRDHIEHHKEMLKEIENL